MAKVVVLGHTIDRCPTCGAMWFDAKELEAVQKDRSAAAEVDVGAKLRKEGPVKARNLDCPRDASRMVEKRFPDQSHILVMECRTCGGRLLDTGELTDVVDYTLAEKIKSFFTD